MSKYIGSSGSAVTPGTENKVRFVATEGQTVFSSLAFAPGFVHVYHNGIRLVDNTDFTQSGGTTITLITPASAGDEVVVISYATLEIADVYRKNEVDAAFVAVTTGSSFPASPNLGDEVFRTDLDSFFKWNGEVWIEL